MFLLLDVENGSVVPGIFGIGMLIVDSLWVPDLFSLLVTAHGIPGSVY